MTPETFLSTNNQRFADNQLMHIRPAHFRAFVADIKATFVALVAANVPRYSATTSYAVDTLVTSNNRFFRARRAGLLAQPVPGQETADWGLEAEPLAPVLPYRTMPLGQAQDYASEGSLQPGTLYRITGRGGDDVLAVAMTRHSLAGADAYLTGVDEQTREEYLAAVTYDLASDTTSERTGGSGVGGGDYSDARAAAAALASLIAGNGLHRGVAVSNVNGYPKLTVSSTEVLSIIHFQAQNTGSAYSDLELFDFYKLDVLDGQYNLASWEAQVLGPDGLAVSGVVNTVANLNSALSVAWANNLAFMVVRHRLLRAVTTDVALARFNYIRA